MQVVSLFYLFFQTSSMCCRITTRYVYQSGQAKLGCSNNNHKNRNDLQQKRLLHSCGLAGRLCLSWLLPKKAPPDMCFPNHRAREPGKSSIGSQHFSLVVIHATYESISLTSHGLTEHPGDGNYSPTKWWKSWRTNGNILSTALQCVKRLKIWCQFF